ncbi:polysaccharide deacetylase family protein [Epilithonimonas caeni]|uniref:polysaccharide deacetylase family protein n=1 Tax=Epilithonimonas caeni TaxID=365343 RepID=UPI0003F78CEA|nr:polysaccharide deacetylase family protein [Epilithonimonas caeni]
MILLSFDIEEFDMPLEYNGEIPLEEQLAVSRKGLQNILRILKEHNIRATFFSTVVFAENNKDLVQQLLSEGHELASHTWFHSEFEEKHLAGSKQELEKLFNTKVVGLRMPRMSPVSEDAVSDAGYFYNSSINPTYLPGRYNNFKVSRKPFWQKKVLQFPASVSTMLRVPLFWLSFHNFPLWIYKLLSKLSLKETGFLNIYFHPWEFADISNPKYKLPNFTFKNTNRQMVNRFEDFIKWAKKNNYQFSTTKDFLENWTQKNKN